MVSLYHVYCYSSDVTNDGTKQETIVITDIPQNYKIISNLIASNQEILTTYSTLYCNW